MSVKTSRTCSKPARSRKVERCAAVTFLTEDVEIRLGVPQHVSATTGLLQAVFLALAEQGRRQLHGTERRVTLVNLQFAVETGLRGV